MIFVSRKQAKGKDRIDSREENRKSQFEKARENQGQKQPNNQETMIKIQRLKMSRLQKRIEHEYQTLKKLKKRNQEKHEEEKE